MPDRAKKKGLPEHIIAAIAEGRRPDPMTADEALAYGVATAAHASGELTDALFAAAEARFGRAGILDLLALCGYYSMLAMALNTARPALPDGTPPPLAPLKGDRR